MRGLVRVFSVISTLFMTLSVEAQSQAEEIEMLKKRLEVLESESSEAKKGAFYTPQVYGSMLTYFNVSTYNGDQRFAVRNAQVGVKGNASNSVSYCIHVNFLNLNKVSVLDSYVRYSTKTSNFTLGQQWIHLTADFDRCGPKTSLFTSRSLGVVYITNYSSGSTLKSLGNRDIGLYGNYKLSTEVPVTLSAGVFNGSGINTADWDNDINLTGRVQIGGSKGLSGGGSIYGGTTTYNQDIMIYSGEVRYVTDRLFVEANYQHKGVDMESKTQITQCGLIEGYYTFKTPNIGFLDSYAPTARYDFGKGMLYSNLVSEEVEEQDAGRLSAIMSFIFKGSKIRSRLCVGYEKFFMKESPSDIAENPLFQDKFTMAVSVAF